MQKKVQFIANKLFIKFKQYITLNLFTPDVDKQKLQVITKHANMSTTVRKFIFTKFCNSSFHKLIKKFTTNYQSLNL